MQVKFVKMSGAGNDFVVADNRAGGFPNDPAEIRRLCDRRFGVGADGLLLVEPATGSADFRMRYYNADGSEAEMCGNGARCIARFYHACCDSRGSELRFETQAGVIEAAILGESVRLKMSDPVDLRLRRTVRLASGSRAYHFLNTGVPHAILPSDDVSAEPVRSLGAEVRHHADFAPRGTNVDFVQVIGPSQLRVRTYERGVEDETLACGTGVVAAALVSHAVQGMPSPVSVTVQSGRMLQVGFRLLDGQYRDVTLSGPADFVFRGELV
jgi:diaminopimelate epimerase